MTTVAKTAVAVQTVAHQHRVASALVLLACGAMANPAMAAAADTAFLPCSHSSRMLLLVT